MPSIAFKPKRVMLFFAFAMFAVCFAYVGAVSAEDASGTAEDLETAERIRVLEAQKIKQDERSSYWGGTGLVFTRTAIVLPRKHLNVSAYFNYSHFQYIQGWQGPDKFDDPRGDDMEMQIVANYGFNHSVEFGAFMNVFLDNEESDPNQLHMRPMGIAWSGANAKIRILDIDKDGLGITTTFFGRLPSPQQDSGLTSGDLGYGGEIEASMKLSVITDWLSALRVHGTFGWAHIDYFETGLAGLYQWARKYNLVNYFARGNNMYYGDRRMSDLFDLSWGVDDVEMKDPYFMADHYTGSIALEYRPINGLSTGIELVGYRMIDYSDDNLMLAPFVTYTFRQIPFMKSVRKDLFTASLAGNLGMRKANRSAPQYGVLLGLTWHTDLLMY